MFMFITEISSDDKYQDNFGLSWKYALPFDVNTSSILTKLP